MSGMNRINSGSTLPLSTNFSVGRQTPDTSFGKRIQAGVSATSSVVGAGLGIAGSAVGGGPAIVSAAISSAMTLGNKSSSGAVNVGAVGASYGALGGSGGINTTAGLSNAAFPTGGGTGSSGGATLTSDMNSTANAGGIDINAQHEKNMELLAIQSGLQQENLMFSSLSNVMKTRHDTSKNSISNMR